MLWITYKNSKPGENLDCKFVFNKLVNKNILRTGENIDYICGTIENDNIPQMPIIKFL